MKSLFMTTALVAFTALPVMAKTTDSAQTGAAPQSGQTQPQAQDQSPIVLGESVQISDLIGKRVFMARHAEVQPGTEQDLSTRTQTNQGGTGFGDTVNRAQPDRDQPQMVGVIRDVILNADGDAEGLIIDAGGYLGIAANEIRLPMQYVNLVPDTQLDWQQTGQQAGQQEQASLQDAEAFSVVYTGEPEAFQQSERFDEAQSTAAGETRGSGTWGQADQQPREVNFSDVSTEELLGAPVYGSQNEWIAEVSELSLGQNGEIENVIIDVGGFLGIGTKPVALTMQDVQLRAYGGNELRAYVPYTEEELDRMETWESDSNL